MKTTEPAIKGGITVSVDPSQCGLICQDHLREAELIQTCLLPAGPLRDDTIDIDFRFQPYFEVGGDFTDFFRLPDGLVGLSLGDVVGKGLPATLYGALVMGTIRGTHKTGTNSARILELLNQRLPQRPLPGRFCSALYAVFDPLTGALTFSNAGLPLPLLVSEAGCRVLGEGGLPSGLFPGASYDQHVVQLAPGDAVLFATDGLHEAENREGMDFSAAQMQAAWAGCWARPAAESLDFLLGRLEGFLDGERLRDDMTVVVLTVPHRQR